MTKRELNLLTKIFHDGETHAIYIDTDSVKVNDSVMVDGRDHAPCMYDYAKELLTLLK